MSCKVYILYSRSLGRYYVGFTGREEVRIEEHNSGKSYWSGRADDWVEVYSDHVATAAEARSLEKRIKSRGAARFLSNRS